MPIVSRVSMSCAIRSKTIRFQLSTVMGETESTKSTNLQELGSHHSTEKLVSFEEWFGIPISELSEELRALRPKSKILVRQPPPHRTITKAFSAVVYTTDTFPLTVRYSWNNMRTNVSPGPNALSISAGGTNFADYRSAVQDDQRLRERARLLHKRTSLNTKQSGAPCAGGVLQIRCCYVEP